MILAVYPKAKVTGKKIPGLSGCLEVFVSDVLAHTKLDGDGTINPKNGAEFIQKVKKIVEG